MRYLWLYGLFLLLFGSSHSRADSPAPPVFEWQPTGEHAAGIYVRGSVLWQNTPCSQAASPTATHFQHFPSFKYTTLLKGKRDQYEGYYCWFMKIPEQYKNQLIHVSLIRVYGLANLSFNGETVWAQDSNEETAGRIDFLYHARSSLILAEFALKCGESPLCGFRGTFKVRAELEGTQIEQHARSLDFFAVAGLTFCFAFHMVFAFLRRRYNAAMMIALMAFALSLRIILTGQGQLHTMFRIPESIYWRLEVFAVLILIPSAISMSRAIFPDDASPRAEKLAWILSIAAMPPLVLAGPVWFIPLMLITYVLIFISIASFFITIKRGFKQRRTAVVTFTCTTIIIISSTFLEVLNARINIELIPGLHPMGFLLTSMIVSVLFATRISEAFSQAEVQEKNIQSMTHKLNQDIALFDQRIEESTRKLRLLIEALPTGIILINQSENGAWQVNGSYSQFLTRTLHFGVNSWSSFHKFLQRLGSATDISSPEQLEESMTALMQHQEPIVRDTLRNLVPERCVWLREEDQGFMQLRLMLVLLPGAEGLLQGAYLFVLDITQLVAIDQLAFKIEVEVGALTELMNLGKAEAQELLNAMEAKDEAHLMALAQKWSLVTLLRILRDTEHATTALTHYLDILVLLLRSYFKYERDQPFDLVKFLEHPIWKQELPSEDFQILQQFIKSEAVHC